MNECNFKLIAKENLYYSGRLWRLKFEAPDLVTGPGQFVNIRLEGHYLRRPFSVCEVEDGVLSLIVQVVGDGTKQLVSTPVGTKLNMLVGLGNGFTIPEAIAGRQVVLLGGGAGYAPLVGLLKLLCRQSDLRPFAVFGFTSEADVPFHHIEELRDEGYPFEYCTLTGEMGDHGNALEVMEEYIEHYNLDPAYFYTCGPMPMMKAVASAFDFDGQLSLEARMGCGFGACMGCTVETSGGAKRICREGPVFKKSELLL